MADTSTPSAPMIVETRRARRVTGITARLVAVGVAAALAGASTAWASHTFTDVPASHPFHDEITWMAETGISTGYSGDTYRPGEPVTRQAMAAFMQRLFDLRDDVAVASDVNWSNAWALDWADFATAEVTVTVPEGTTAVVLADFTGMTTCYSGGPGDSCLARILLDGVEMQPDHGEGGSYTLASNDDATHTSNDDEGHSIVRWVGSVDPGDHTVTVQTKVTSLGLSYSITDWVLTAEAILSPTA